ncbi:MAG: fused MFS/spermidine synthase [Polyangiaceae bacterium]|nr:fused MFS/spermidine synthase [Polyangiaceae bacterium]
MPKGTDIARRVGTSAALLASAALACDPRTVAQQPAVGTARAPSATRRETAAPARLTAEERIVFDGTSPYSHLQVIDAGSTRTLLFVHDDGQKVVESRYRLDAPDRLDVAYTSVMFSSFLLRPNQSRCLIVGLGGGSMVRFLERFFPEVAIDVVEIDPLVVEVAAKYFQVEASERVRIITQDATDFMAQSRELYDVVYLDAFLKVSDTTDSTGVPLELRTLEFLSKVRQRLRPRGLVVSNIHERPSTPNDIETLGTGFGTVYVFPVPGTGNIVVVSSLSPERVQAAELERRGRELDQGCACGLSFQGVARMLRP